MKFLANFFSKNPTSLQCSWCLQSRWQHQYEQEEFQVCELPLDIVKHFGIYWCQESFQGQLCGVRSHALKFLMLRYIPVKDNQNQFCKYALKNNAHCSKNLHDSFTQNRTKVVHQTWNTLRKAKTIFHVFKG